MYGCWEVSESMMSWRKGIMHVFVDKEWTWPLSTLRIDSTGARAVWDFASSLTNQKG